MSEFVNAVNTSKYYACSNEVFINFYFFYYG